MTEISILSLIHFGATQVVDCGRLSTPGTSQKKNDILVDNFLG
jgi:hypothetical protein